MEFRLEATGVADALKQLDPKHLDRARYRWFREGTERLRVALRVSAPPVVAGLVKIKMDPLFPPGWALVGSTHPLAHIFEGGTGRMGAPGFRHEEHFPRVTGRGGLMETTGLPRPQAFAIALSISQQGGLEPKPFVAPTFEAERGQLEALAERIVSEELGL